MCRCRFANLFNLRQVTVMLSSIHSELEASDNTDCIISNTVHECHHGQCGSLLSGSHVGEVPQKFDYFQTSCSRNQQLAQQLKPANEKLNDHYRKTACTQSPEEFQRFN
jgi:hypothetical protein